MILINIISFQEALTLQKNAHTPIIYIYTHSHTALHGSKLATCSYRKPKMAWLKEKGALNIIFFIDSLYSGTLDNEKKSCQNIKQIWMRARILKITNSCLHRHPIYPLISLFFFNIFIHFSCAQGRIWVTERLRWILVA